VARQLVDGLQSDLVTEGLGYWARMGDRRPTALDTVMRRAISADEIRGVGRRWEAAARWVGWRV
jgi:hypothetical protein